MYVLLPTPCVRAHMCRTPWPKCLSSLYHCGTVKNTAPALFPAPMGTIKLQGLAVVEMALGLNYLAW